LLSYLAFSKSVALRDLEYLAHDLGWLGNREAYEQHKQHLQDLKVEGLPADAVAPSPRRGSVSLADARQAAEDFLFLRTTSSSRNRFELLYSLAPLFTSGRLQDLAPPAPILVVRGEFEYGHAGIVIYDGRARKRAELEFDPRAGYLRRGGIEFPASPLRVIRIWEETEDPAARRERDLEGDAIVLSPRSSF
jgi:hypothetical protein